MTPAPLKIAITGHVDHGKSTLIGRILLDTNSLPEDREKDIRSVGKEFGSDAQLAYLADQLKEERDNNITIETTQIFFSWRRRPYCLIDTPGHLEYIKNTLTGASHADAAILMVDAKDGIQEQTRRHAYLLRLLSVPRLLVVVNKMDSIGYDRSRFADLDRDIRELLSGMNAPVPAAVIPVSAKHGTNIRQRSRETGWYRHSPLLTEMERCRVEAAVDTTNVCFPVQDVFPVEGTSILLGRMHSGALQRRQAIRILPENTPATVRDILAFDRKVVRTSTGESIGLAIDPAGDFHRGQIVCAADDTLAVPRSFTGNIFWFAESPLRCGDTLQVRCATQEFSARVTAIRDRLDPASLNLLEPQAVELCANETAIVDIEPLEPAVLEPFFRNPELGRFIIEQHDDLFAAGTVTQVTL